MYIFIIFVHIICTDVIDSFGLAWLYGTSTIIGYLMLNPVFTYILNIRVVNTFC